MLLWVKADRLLCLLPPHTYDVATWMGSLWVGCAPGEACRWEGMHRREDSQPNLREGRSTLHKVGSGPLSGREKGEAPSALLTSSPVRQPSSSSGLARWRRTLWGSSSAHSSGGRRSSIRHLNGRRSSARAGRGAEEVFWCYLGQVVFCRPKRSHGLFNC